MLSYKECLENLIELGKKNEYLTFKQINEILPNSPLFLDKIDDLISDLTETGIEIIDETQKKVTKKSVSVKKNPQAKKFKNRRYYDDPVRMYLKEMGRVPLLDRDGEIRIAKKIESGQKWINRYVFMSGSSLREMHNFLHRFKEKESGWINYSGSNLAVISINRKIRSLLKNFKMQLSHLNLFMMK